MILNGNLTVKKLILTRKKGIYERKQTTRIPKKEGRRLSKLAGDSQGGKLRKEERLFDGILMERRSPWFKLRSAARNVKRRKETSPANV